MREDLLQLAIADILSALYSRKPEEIAFADATFFVKADIRQCDSDADILRRNNKAMMEACVTTTPASRSASGAQGAPCRLAPTASEENSDGHKYSFSSFGAQFAEVWVDEDLGTIRIKRFTSVQDIGRLMNETTARSQVIGGVVWGIGAALTEATEYDRAGPIPSLAPLPIITFPVNLDVPEIDVQFIGKPDPHISPIVRGALTRLALWACRRPSQTPSSTRLGSASAICRSGPTNSFEEAASTKTTENSISTTPFECFPQRAGNQPSLPLSMGF